MIEGTEAASAARRREREWWLRALAVFGSPRTAFSGLRDDSREAAEARQEPVLALALLAGIEGVLATPAVGDLLDGRERDALVVAVLVFLAGTLYGVASYWIGGGALHLGVRAAGGTGSYRQARHVLAFAAAPLALTLLVLWPVRLLLYGGDLFRTGGSDESGAAPVVLDVVEAGFFLWAAGLLVYGVSTVNRWPVLRSLVALALAGLGLVAVATVFALL
ncbi:MAG: YIP1 family protein [Actinomycetota bacterium]|nr:YIP1 family protein [Actinomycetota bacterium]